ncbi:unnamed protein product [Cuscuta campestris]|uniref:Ubiquitin-like protease family profile domain-containing protein n=1 Tax=Cuscuta campestris TaxID=132261 RepID=A0A484LNC5_9ASTE|nr:unnamed protein product [Cuscuta campestris]
MASPIRRSGRLQLAEIMKRPKVHAVHVDLGNDDKDSVEDGGANGNDNAISDVSGDDAVFGGDEGGNVEEETDSDDAFDDPPQKTTTDPSPSASRKNAATVKKRKREGITKLKEKYLRIQSRASPNVLQKVVEALNEDQRREVVRIGFGSMLKIKITELPAKLGFWVVEKFNPRSSSIVLADGTKVRVTVDDIRHVLGLPCGRAKVFYVDRVVLYRRDVERMSPAFLGWTSKILRDRENNEVKAGGFGLGYDDGRFVGEVVDASSGGTDVGAGLEQDNVENGNGDAPEPMGETRDDPVEVFVQKFAEKGRILATTIIELVSLIESAPPGTMENDLFKQLQLAAGRLLGLAQRRGGGSLETPQGGFSEVTYDEGFWSDPANIDQLIANEQAVLARSKYKKIMEQAVDMDLAGGNRIQADRIGMTAVAGVSAVGDGTVQGTVTECSKAVVKPLNAARKRVTNWVLQNPNAPKDEAVFVKDGLELTRGEIASLDIGKHISKRVIDVLSTILNHNEKFRSDNSPLRVFARSMDCVANGDIVDVSEANVKNMFANALLPAWDDMADDFNWGKAELFFFPIMQQNWAYVLCVDLKSRRCDILDSSSAKAKNEDRYGDMPKRVVRLLGDFLEQQRFVYKGKCVREMLAKRITFPWRDPKATFDYGVATMRHMETYMGDGGKGWNSGLSKINQKPMLLLRCKYCACILLSPVNALLDKVYAESETLERERKGKDPK